MPLVSSAPVSETFRRTGHVLTLSCPDAPGLVQTVSTAIFNRGGDIVESEQFGDRIAGRFFMRVQFVAAGSGDLDLEGIKADVAAFASDGQLTWSITDASRRQRVLIMVSKFGHCLNDLLFRQTTGYLHMEVPVVVSNHPDLGELADHFDVPFHHIPVTSDTKSRAESELIELIDELDIDLVVLARYMQILSEDLTKRLDGRAINIHHSMLPSFKGARPYDQAYERGVKLVGATAHYVTADLDEGPIIDQQVARIDHRMTPEDMAAIGRDTEAFALARAVRWHTENRVLLDGRRTVVLR
jgi:formyltetrahydrofolate deformylase